MNYYVVAILYNLLTIGLTTCTGLRVDLHVRIALHLTPLVFWLSVFIFCLVLVWIVSCALMVNNVLERPYIPERTKVETLWLICKNWQVSHCIFVNVYENLIFTVKHNIYFYHDKGLSRNCIYMEGSQFWMYVFSMKLWDQVRHVLVYYPPLSCWVVTWLQYVFLEYDGKCWVSHCVIGLLLWHVKRHLKVLLGSI